MAKQPHVVLLSLALLGFFCTAGYAQENVNPYSVTYTHYMEELDSLEISANVVNGHARDINPFLGSWVELEYGARHWWTAAVYLDWQHTKHEGNVFTGFRFENRFRPFLEEHRINPVLYVEYENLNDADKSVKEVVGFDGREDFSVPNSVARETLNHELDTKLILSSQIKGWNISENLIAEKNLKQGPWEFGYAMGVSRPLKLSSIKGACLFCPERFVAGVEMYGGLAEWNNLTLHGTSHYIAPVLTWTMGDTTVRISPGWGITDDSFHTLVRFSVSQEIDDFAHNLRKLFH